MTNMRTKENKWQSWQASLGSVPRGPGVAQPGQQKETAVYRENKL